ncbi:unnamed protein product [Amoebophrya sp. A120]|nr:unnamed protein product [Amoebophrya sp. A120]|eukprot:GSA120T00025294001.1
MSDPGETFWSKNPAYVDPGVPFCEKIKSIGDVAVGCCCGVPILAVGCCCAGCYLCGKSVVSGRNEFRVLRDKMFAPFDEKKIAKSEDDDEIRVGPEVFFPPPREIADARPDLSVESVEPEGGLGLITLVPSSWVFIPPEKERCLLSKDQAEAAVTHHDPAQLSTTDEELAGPSGTNDPESGLDQDAKEPVSGTDHADGEVKTAASTTSTCTRKRRTAGWCFAARK